MNEEQDFIIEQKNIKENDCMFNVTTLLCTLQLIMVFLGSIFSLPLFIVLLPTIIPLGLLGVVLLNIATS